jgi:hypothetical protein
VPLGQWSGYWTDEHAEIQDSPIEFFDWLFIKSIMIENKKNE